MASVLGINNVVALLFGMLGPEIAELDSKYTVHIILIVLATVATPLGLLLVHRPYEKKVSE